MLRALVLVCCVPGCGSIFDLEHVTLPTGDGGAGNGDVNGDAADGGLPCFGGDNGGFVRVCFEPDPNDLWLPVASIDTDTMCEKMQPQANGRELCIISAASIVISAAITVRGSRPLVLVGTSTLTLNAALGVNSTRANGGRTGPGANASPCVVTNEIDGDDYGPGGGGGAGGTHGGPGGSGGNGALLPSSGGSSQAVAPLVALRGGCPGGDGGNAVADSGGDGGGAIYLIAGTELSLDAAVINASGMAGRAGEAAKQGGGGGGAGGMIVLDAPSITLNDTILIAHGVGGGGGGDATSEGYPGFEVSFSTYESPGGPGGFNSGGNGGNGSKLLVPQGAAGLAGGDGSATLVEGGGGGGGGGHGVIKIFSPNMLAKTGTVVISPEPQP